MGRIEFHPLCLSDEEILHPYMDETRFGDVTFRTLYAWQPMFEYELGFASGFPVITGVSRDGVRSYILYRKEDEDPDLAIQKLLQYIAGLDEPESKLTLEYVAEDELDIYRSAAQRLNLNLSIDYDSRFSDYLYLREDFISLAGSRNKSQRGDDRALHRLVPELKVLHYTQEQFTACMEIFQNWCAEKNCQDCFNGCEQQAFARFMEVYDPELCFALVSYNGTEPLSFLVGERLGFQTYDHHFQKNRERIRGLTAYLGRLAAAAQPEGSIVNLEEDMGIPGIREDKEKLHPFKKADKYTLTFSMT